MSIETCYDVLTAIGSLAVLVLLALVVVWCAGILRPAHFRPRYGRST